MILGFRSKHGCWQLFAVGLVAVLVLGRACGVYAGQTNISLAWDPSPDASVVGYNIYYGKASRSYDQKLNVGNVTTATVPGLDSGVTYYFAATAYNSEMLESEFSNEAVCQPIESEINHPPTLDPIPAVSFRENVPGYTVSLTGITCGDGGKQSVTVSAASSNPQIVPTPDVTGSEASGWSLVFPAATRGTALVTVTVQDGQAVNGSVSRSFEVTVTAGGNVAPTIDPLPDVTVFENSGEQTIQLTGISAGEGENQTIEVNAVCYNRLLLSIPTVIYTSPNGTGQLKFTPVPYAHGSVMVLVSVYDGQPKDNTTRRSFYVHIVPVNQPPTLDPIQNITLSPDSGETVVNLTGISSGQASEDQPLTVTATSSNPSIVAHPRVQYAPGANQGSLIFAAPTGGAGSAMVTVTVNDGAQTNATVVRTFNVTVLGGNQPPTLDPISDVQLLEETTPVGRSVRLTGIGPGGASENQTLSVTARSSDPALLPHPTVAYTSPNNTAWVTFTPTPYASGTCQVDVTVSDGQSANGTVMRSFKVSVASVNQPPTLSTIENISLEQNGPQQVVRLTGIGSGAPNEDQVLTLGVSSSNPGLIPQPVVEYSSPSATANVYFQPAAGAFGTATLTATVNDGGQSNNIVARSFTVSVGQVNRPPTLDTVSDRTITENSDTQIIKLTGITAGANYETNQVVSITAFSSDPALISQVSASYAHPSAEGSLALKPNPDAFGTAVITVVVSDGQAVNGSFARTFRVTIAPVNRPPTLDPIANVTMTENAGLYVIPLAGLSAGALHEQQTLTISASSSDTSLVAHPQINYASPNSSGWLSFTPKPFAFGTCTITVTVDDGQTTNHVTTRSFTVAVSPVNQAPTLNQIADVVLEENTPQHQISLAGIGSGATNENQTLTVTAQSGNQSLIPSPSISYSSPGAVGTLTIRPVAGAFGNAQISVTVNDGGDRDNSVTRVFTVTVGATNRPPTLDAIADVVLQENTAQQSVNLTGIGSGAAHEAQALQVTAKSSNPAVLPDPGVVYSSPASTGKLLLSPAADAAGVAMVTVTVNDGGKGANSVSRTFKVTVNAVNRAPTLDPIADITLDEGAAQQVIALRGISAGASGESQILSITAVSSDRALIPDPRMDYTNPNSTGTLSFSPTAYASGTCTITVTVNDGQSVNNLTARSFRVTIRGVNQAPTLGFIPDLKLAENAAEQTVLLAGISSGAPNEAQTLTITASSANPALVPAPVVEYSSPATTGILKLRPAAGMSGSTVVTVSVSDGAEKDNVTTRSFTVTVEPANRAPTIDPIQDVIVYENSGAKTIAVTGITPGAPQESQTVVLSARSSDPTIIPDPVVSYTPSRSDGTITITPAHDKHGTALITVTAQDGQAVNASFARSFRVTVQPVNRPPTLDEIGDILMEENAKDFQVEVHGISSGADFERQPLSVSAVSSDTGLLPTVRVVYSSPNSTATLLLTPAPYAFGNCQVTVSVSDGQGTNGITSRTFGLNVRPVNQAPTLNHIQDLAIAENAPDQKIELTGISSGISNEVQALVLTASSSNPALIPNPTVDYRSPNSTANLSFKPAPGAFGSAIITVNVDDGADRDSVVSRSFTVTVGPVNRRPTLDPIANVELPENTTQTVRLTGISPGASFETQTVTIGAISSDAQLMPNPQVVYVSPAAEAVLTLAPNAGRFGTVGITVTASDGQSEAGTVTRSFIVKVLPVNRPPTLDPVADLVVDEDAGPITVHLQGITAGATHETQAVVVRATSSNPELLPQPAVMHAAHETTGSLTLVPAPNSTGFADITVTVDDGQPSNNLLARTFRVVVREVNDPPTLDKIASQAILENTSGRTISLTGLSAGAGETQRLTVTATSSDPAVVPHPTVLHDGWNASATLTLAPVQGAFGRVTISVIVNDGQPEFGITTETFVVDVLPVNRPPTIDAIADVVVQENSGQKAIQITGIGSGRTEEQQTLIITTVSSNPVLVPAPSVSYTSPNAQGALIIRPTANSSGTAVITVFVNDGASSGNVASRSFNVTVVPQNRPPTLDAINNLALQGNSPARIVPLTGITCGPTSESQAVTVHAMSSDPSLVPHPRVEYTVGTEGRLVLEPARGVSGSVVISVTVDDGQPVANQITRTFVVTISDLNHAPTLDPIAEITIPENGSETVVLSGISSGAPNEDQALHVTAVSSNPKLLVPVVSYSSPDTRGVLSFVPTPFMSGTAVVTVTVSDGEIVSGSVARSFVVKVVDVNQPPTLDGIDSRSIEENSGPQFVQLTGISSGAPDENQRLTVTASSSNPALIPNPSVIYTNPSTSGVLSFNTVPNASGESMITVQVNDGQSSNNIVARKFRVTVASVNQKPTLNPLANLTMNENAGPQTITVGGISSGAPNESQRLTVMAFSSRPDVIPHPVVSYVSPNTFATLSFTPVPYASGSATVTVTVDDGQSQDGTTTRAFTITVNAVNQAPTIDPIAAVVVAKNAPAQVIPITGITSGASNEIQTLTVTATSSNTKLVPTPALSYISPQNTGFLTLPVATNLTGTATITVTVRDGGQQNGTTSRSFLVAVGVGGVGGTSNTPPTLAPIPNVTVRENAPAQVVQLSGVSSGDASENQPLTITAISSSPAIVPHPVVQYTSPASGGQLVIKPATNAFGGVTISVTVDDGQSGNNTCTRTFSVIVTPVNNPPTINPLPNIGLPRDSGARTLTLTGLTPGPANELQALTVRARSSDTSVIAEPGVTYKSGNSTATLSLVPVFGAVGKSTITVTVDDGQAENSSFERSFEVEILSENVQPTLDSIADVRLPVGTQRHTVALTGISAGNPYESQALTVFAMSSDTSLLPNPVVNFNSPDSTGTLVLSPAPGKSGSAVVTVVVDDGQQISNTLSRSFVVTLSEASAGVELGSAVVPAGDTNSVPLVVATDLSGTNLTFSIALPAASLTNLTLQNLAPEADPASVRVQWLTATNAQVRLAARAGLSFTGDRVVARLGFRAVGTRTARVPLKIVDPAVALSCGSSVAAKVMNNGEVLVLGNEPFLQPSVGSDGARQLTVLGKVGNAYTLEVSTNSGPSAVWTPLSLRIGLTNSSVTVTLPAQAGPQVFYRAVELRAFPPVLVPLATAGTSHKLTIFGEPGAVYTLQRTGTLSPGPGAWTNIVTMGLTNSFGTLEVPSSGPVSLFRLLKH